MSYAVFVIFLTDAVFELLGINWRRLVDVLFSSEFGSKFSPYLNVVIYSFCRLWRRMVKACSHRSEVMSSSVVDSTRVLLSRLKTGGQLSTLCHGKCLGVLMETVCCDPGHSSPVVAWRLTFAKSALNVLYSFDDKHSSDMLALFNCCLFRDKDYRITCGGSEFSAADNHVCVAVETSEGRTSEHLITTNPLCVAATTSAGNSENVSFVLNRRLTTSHGLCSGMHSHFTRRALSEESVDCDVVLYDGELVRKFVLFILRCLDIITREPADHCMAGLLIIVTTIFVYYLLLYWLFWTAIYYLLLLVL